MRYLCEGCKKHYATPEEALNCEAKLDPIEFNIGDFVTTSLQYGWFDGDPAWIASDIPAPEGRSYSGRFYTFVFVIGAITTHEHTTRYHLWTKACGQVQGWVTRGHYFPKLYEADPKIKDQASEFIGKSHGLTSLLH